MDRNLLLRKICLAIEETKERVLWSLACLRGVIGSCGRHTLLNLRSLPQRDVA